MREIDLRMTVDEVNVLLDALGQQPFAKVYALVAKIQQQASEQLAGGEAGGGPLFPTEEELDAQ